MNKDYMIVPTKIMSIKEVNIDGADYAEVNCIDSFYENIDLGQDRVRHGAFSEDLKINGNERACLINHDSRQLPVGKNIYSDSLKGLMSKVLLPIADDMVKGRLLPQLKLGSITGRSIRYEPIEYDYETIDNMRIRNLKKLKLYESSFVNFPMNPKCMILSLQKCVSEIDGVQFKGLDNTQKSFFNDYAETLGIEIKTSTAFKNYGLLDEGTSWDKAKAVNQIKENTESKDAPSKNYKDGFMWFNEKEPDKFTSYKLPYVYFNNGFKAVPKALYAIAGAIAGARGGLDIPDADKDKIKVHLNKYYKKLGKESPFQDDGKCKFDIDTVKALEKRDLIKIFDNDIILSNNAKEYIINNLSHSESNDGDASDNDILQKLKEISQTAIKFK